MLTTTIAPNRHSRTIERRAVVLLLLVNLIAHDLPLSAATVDYVDQCLRQASAEYDYENDYPPVPDSYLSRGAPANTNAEDVCRSALLEDGANAQISFHLGRVLMNGGRLREGAEHVKAAANDNYLAAQLLLGVAYHNGDFGESDYEKARYWWSKAASQGHAESEFFLGAMYLQGRGVETDYGRAFELLNNAATQGHPGGEYLLGTMYYRGQYVDKDAQRAFDLFKSAANQGHVQAKFSAGMMYIDGQGTTKNTALGLANLVQSANDGFVLAQAELGKLFYTGDLVPKDEQEALRWFCMAGAFGEEYYFDLSDQHLTCK